MRRLKTGIKVIAGLLGLVVLVCCGLLVYVIANKQKVIDSAIAGLKQRVNGELHVGSASLRLSPHLPGVAISLEDVWIRDSLWQQHGQTLVTARQFYITLNPLPLLTGKVRAGTLRISHGRITLYTDTTGYSNMSALKNDDDKKKKGKTPEINDLRLDDMRIVIRHEVKDKDFDFAISKLRVQRKSAKQGWSAKVTLATVVHSMAFNTEKGSFLEGKKVSATLKCSYDEEENSITIPLQELTINKQHVNTRGKFTFNDGEAARFELYFGTEEIRYQEAMTLLTPGISNKIPDFDFADPVAVQATLIGHAAYRDTPHVHVAWQVRDNTFKTPRGTIRQCSFRGSYDNERVRGAGYKDPNALITVSQLTGVWEGIKLKIDTLSIADLVNPLLEGTLAAEAEMASLNNLAGGSAFVFTGGHMQTEVKYKGGLAGADTAKPYVKGMLRIDDASLTYKPRGIKFTNTNARIRFTGSDVVADTLTLSCGKSTVGLQGTFEDFLHLFYTSPEKIVMSWDVTSKIVDLTELIPLLRARSYEAPKRQGDHVSMIPQQLGHILANNQVNMNVSVDRLVYKDFAATNISCRLALDSNGFTLTNARLKHAGGNITANVLLTQEKTRNRYKLDASVSEVSIRPFFKAFNDFGQGAVTHEEIGGTFSADVQATGYLDSDGKPVERSINGEAAFSLSNGYLTNFAPMKAIGTLLFRRRQMDSITFREISNKLTINEGKIFVPPLHIESNAINLVVSGVYATAGKGTNMEIDVPLRNPEKDSMITNEALRHKRHMKGVVLRLRATKDDDGDLKIRFR